jgi:outer membrane protein OmpA-like peptidoglycan-associated protein
MYRNYFDKVLDLASKYPGAIIVVEGHADPKAYNDSAASKKPQIILDQIRLAAKNLSISRANAVRDSIITYAKNSGLTIDASQFTVMGSGIDNPKFPNPRTEEEWKQNMQVTFQIIQVEAELDSFTGGK